MEYKTPVSYKNYLPSKSIRIIIGIILLVGISYFATPWLIRTFRKKLTPQYQKGALSVLPLSGDPVTRDTDNDGVTDWQEILLGLDINNPQSKPGVPDMATFQMIKNQVGASTFDFEVKQITDTDKVSLTIYDALSKDSRRNNGISTVGTQTITEQELYNYIAAQKDKLRVYTEKDLITTTGSLENNQKYAQNMRTVLADDDLSKNGPERIQQYLDDKSTRQDIQPMLSLLQKKVILLLEVPVPPSAIPMHLEIINSAQGIYELLDQYLPNNDDPTSKISTVSLVQDYLIKATKSFGLLQIYLSVALDKNGY